jgi:hypothetical protein
MLLILSSVSIMDRCIASWRSSSSCDPFSPCSTSQFSRKGPS